MDLQITPLRREYQDKVLGCFVKCTLLSWLSYNKLQINVVIRGLQLIFFFREHLRKTHLPFSDIITKCLQLISRLDRHFPTSSRFYMIKPPKELKELTVIDLSHLPLFTYPTEKLQEVFK